MRTAAPVGQFIAFPCVGKAVQTRPADPPHETGRKRCHCTDLPSPGNSVASGQLPRPDGVADHGTGSNSRRDAAKRREWGGPGRWPFAAKRRSSATGERPRNGMPAVPIGLACRQATELGRGTIRRPRRVGRGECRQATEFRSGTPPSDATARGGPTVPRWRHKRRKVGAPATLETHASHTRDATTSAVRPRSSDCRR